MSKAQDQQAALKFAVEFTGTGIIGPADPIQLTVGEQNLRVAVEGVGGGNVILVKGRLRNQAAFQTLDTITGTTSGATIDVSVVNEVQFSCTTFSASGTPKLIACGFFRSASSGGGGGSINTASNVGVGGVGLFDSVVGDDLQFRNINAGSNKISVTLDGPNLEVDIDAVPANFDKNTLGGSALTIANGGTGATTAATARSNLGSTVVGDALFTTASAAAARTTLGSGATGDTLFQSATAASARGTLGSGATGDTLFQAATAGSARTTLGSGATGDTLFQAATAASARSTLGSTVVGDALFTAVDATAARSTISAASTSHQSTHQSGGSDALTGLLDANARLAVSKNSAATTGTRRKLNLIEGTNISLTVADDSGNEEVDVTIGTSITAQAPADAQYLTLALNGSLSAERVFTPGEAMVATDGGANGNYTLNRRDFRTYSKFSTDFIEQSATLYFTDNSAGTGSSFALGTGTAAHPGILALASGTTATSRSIGNQGTSALLAGGGTLRFMCNLSLSALSTALQTYTARVGFIDSGTTTESTDGVFFRYTSVGLTPNWICVSRSNNTETVLDSGVAVSAGTFVTLQAEINAAGTSITYSIDGTSVGTISTNIPTATGREFGNGFGLYKTNGSGTSYTMSVDYYEWTFIPTATR